MRFPGISRRNFLKTSAILAAGGAVTGGVYWQMRDTIPLALIGAGSRGFNLARDIHNTAYFPLHGKLLAICDVDRKHAQATKARYAPHADVYEDYRKVIERDDIQAVFIATPDHWHTAIALAAMRAGKAVYCEKPMTLTIDEGKLLVQAVEQTGAVFQVGTQQRSSDKFQLACELVRNGRLGKLHTVTVSLPEFASGGPFPAQPIPEGLNWDLWLGQAPWAEYCEQRCHKLFRSWYDYSGGSMTDWGAHHMDIVQWALGVEDAGPLTIDGQAEMPRIVNGFTTPANFTVDMLYPQDVRVQVRTSKTESGIVFEGDRGRILVNRRRVTGKPVEDLRRNPLPTDAIRCRNSQYYVGNCWTIHIRDFYDCIKTGKKPISDVHSQHRSISACHLANISMRVGRKLKWDAVRQEIVGDAEANAMLSRTQRSEYALPAELAQLDRPAARS